ncbi:MAG: FHA domain-containing protein [Lachnospiraceae bacterium]|nr:FHA domain-containing protein [Lachnospiraceae bacterium]
MLHTEYVRNLNCNYERILLDNKPEEKKYQYCILSRGGIKGLLPCSLRYMNGLAYLYYDITSKQNVAQLFGGRCITRRWMRDFLWSLRQIQLELGRFLLDTNNVIWYPEHIFQDLESNIFSFLYIPYYSGEESFIKLIEFWVEHIDYDDEVLVDCVYHMYEQLEHNGTDYLQSRIYEDTKCLEESTAQENSGSAYEIIQPEKEVQEQNVIGKDGLYNLEDKNTLENGIKEEKVSTENNMVKNEQKTEAENSLLGEKNVQQKSEKRSLLSIFEGRRNRSKKMQEDYTLAMRQAMLEQAVAEDVNYSTEEFGQTIYIEDKQEDAEEIRKIYTPEGKLLAKLEKKILSIGKKREEVDLVLEDMSVSRIHARILDEKGSVYLEDLNSTNGTFKNGLRLQPYEKRKLEIGDEIKCGKIIIIFR